MRDNTKYSPIINISIIENTLFTTVVPCVSYHMNVEKNTNKQYINSFTYVFIELGKFDEKANLENVTEDEKDWYLS